MPKEFKTDVANAILQHGLSRLEGFEYHHAITDNYRHYENAIDRVGDFYVSHTRPERGGRGWQILDISSGKKLFSMRIEDGEDAWRIVAFKRGDWETAFLLT